MQLVCSNPLMADLPKGVQGVKWR